MNQTKLKQLVKETLEATLNEEGALAEGGTLQNTAKGAAMALLDMAKVMEQSPSHEPASHYAQEVAKQANLIMDMLVEMEDNGKGLQEAGPPSDQERHYQRAAVRAADEEKEWTATSGDEQSWVGALTSIEHEADGLEKGANVMIKGHEMGIQLDNNAIGKIILKKANKIRGHVKRHREQMSQPF